MKPVTIYSTPICPYCVRAKTLLKNKGVPYKEKDASQTNTMQEMLLKSHGRRSVPQIFIGEDHVGGFDDLYALEKDGKLDSLLAD